MKLFDVYPLLNIEPVKAKDCTVTDKQGAEYLDLYGGHAVISIGHSHPHYVKMISEQVGKLGFYSNSVQNPLQQQLADKLGELSGYDDYALFLCSSGAEANENALKLASFHTGKKKVIAFHKAFHGRTSAAVSVTDNPNITAPVNANHEVIFLPMNDIETVEKTLTAGDVCAVIIEGIQGVAGIYEPEAAFLQSLSALCTQHQAALILDEVQSGYGRTGKFFAHQYAGITPDLITMAKGMGNGFPVGGVLISSEFKASYGLLGTTFGGSHLACAAAIAVLDVIKGKSLMHNAQLREAQLRHALRAIPEVNTVRGKGLMIGLSFNFPIKSLRTILIQKHHILTGVASDPNVLRLLPPLSVTESDINHFITSLKASLKDL